jgi:hypothetical protein
MHDRGSRMNYTSDRCSCGCGSRPMHTPEKEVSFPTYVPPETEVGEVRGQIYWLSDSLGQMMQSV